MGWCSQYTDIVYSTVDGRSWEGVVSILTLCTALWMAEVGRCSEYTDIVYSAVDGRIWEGVVSILTLCKVLWMAGVGKV